MRGELQVATAGLSWLASLPGPNGLCLALAYPPALSGVRPGPSLWQARRPVCSVGEDDGGSGQGLAAPSRLPDLGAWPGLRPPERATRTPIPGRSWRGLLQDSNLKALQLRQLMRARAGCPPQGRLRAIWIVPSLKLLSQKAH